MFPTLRAENKLYEEERKTSNALPHRKRDLEWAVANLQLGPLVTRVHAIIDRHIAALPTLDKRSERDLTWQLTISRMDLRQYDVIDTPLVVNGAPSTESDEPSKNYVHLEPKPATPQVQQLIDENTKKMGEMNARLSVYMWGLQAFERKAGSADPTQWREKLQIVLSTNRSTEYPDGTHNAPGFVAAVCVRDHWREMSREEKAWCVDVICSEVARYADQWRITNRMQQFSMQADRPCAVVIPLLLFKPLTEAQTPRVHQALLLH